MVFSIINPSKVRFLSPAERLIPVPLSLLMMVLKKVVFVSLVVVVIAVPVVVLMVVLMKRLPMPEVREIAVTVVVLST